MNPTLFRRLVKGISSGSPMLRVTYNQGISELNSVNNTFSDSDLKSYWLLILYPYLHPYVLLLLCHFSGSEGNLASAETSEDEVEGQKFIVNGEEAQEQLTRGVIQREEKLIHQHQRKVLPLFKPRQHQKHRKHGKHGSRARNFRDE